MSAVSTPATSVSPTPSVKEPVSHVFGGKISKRVPEIVSGKGSRIIVRDPYTGATRELLDGMTGAAVGALGWGDEDVLKFVNDAAKACCYQFPIAIGNQYAEELAKFYIDRSPKDAFAAAIWTTSGSESNELCLKTIRQYWLERGKPEKIKNLSRYTSYHGYSVACLSLGHSNRSFPFQEILNNTGQMVKLPEYLPYHYAKEGESDEDYSLRLLKEYEEIILREDPNTIASITIEPVSGTSLGTPCPTKTYIHGIRKLCDKYDILFHADEVMCGTGRINPNGGLNCWENFLPLNEGPDLQTVGKTLGSGVVTIAGLLVSPKVRDVFVNGSDSIAGSSTYSCHGFNCYVALQIQKKVAELNLTKNMFEQGNYLGAQLKEKLSDFKTVGNVRGLGGFWTVEFVQDKKAKKPFQKKVDYCHLISNKANELGLQIVGGTDNIRGVGGDFVMFAPHFTVTKEEVDEMVAILTKAVKEVEEKVAAEGLI